MSADDNAPEQAREVEVVARVLVDDLNRRKYRLDDISEYLPVAEDILRALAPIRAAERQEAARAALLAAAEECSTEIRWQALLHSRGQEVMTRLGCIERIDVLRAVFRGRADGVTGRSGT